MTLIGKWVLFCQQDENAPYNVCNVGEVVFQQETIIGIAIKPVVECPVQPFGLYHIEDTMYGDRQCLFFDNKNDLDLFLEHFKEGHSATIHQLRMPHE